MLVKINSKYVIIAYVLQIRKSQVSIFQRPCFAIGQRSETCPAKKTQLIGHTAVRSTQVSAHGQCPFPVVPMATQARSPENTLKFS